MALLGIDFGERRIGVAWCHGEQGFPTALRTVQRVSDRQAIEALAEIADEHDAELLIIGEPVDAYGERGENCERVRRFALKLRARTGLEIALVPETLTTVAASERLAERGIRPERFSPGLDAVSAELLLEEFLARPIDERGALRLRQNREGATADGSEETRR